MAISSRSVNDLNASSIASVEVSSAVRDQENDATRAEIPIDDRCFESALFVFHRNVLTVP